MLGAGFGYTDDCTTLSINYSRSYTDAVAVGANGYYNNENVNQTVLVSLNLRTLADFKLNQSLGATSTVQDGLYK